MDSADLICAALAGWSVAVDGKRPLHQWGERKLDHGEVADHLRHEAAATVMPASLGLMMVNSDICGESVESDELFARADSALGKPVAWHGSRGGGRHLWYRSCSPFASKPLKQAGKHVGELPSDGALVTVHKPAEVGRVLRHYADLADRLPRVPDAARSAAGPGGAVVAVGYGHRAGPPRPCSDQGGGLARCVTGLAARRPRRMGWPVSVVRRDRSLPDEPRLGALPAIPGRQRQRSPVRRACPNRVRGGPR